MSASATTKAVPELIVTHIKRTAQPCSRLIGTAYWRNNSFKEIKLSEDVICKSDKSIEFGRSVDPVYHVRDILAVLSNDEAHKYSRQVRLVVHRLTERIIEINEEMLMLNRCREAVEKEYEHICKDLAVNIDSQRIRRTRPPREKCTDGADDLLDAERVHILNLKKMLEIHLRMILEQLQTCADARKRMICVCRERSVVLELICRAVPAVGSQHSYIKRFNIAPKTKAFSDPCKCDEPLFPTDNLGALTPEVEKSMQDALSAMMMSAKVRRDADSMVIRSQQIQKAAHDAVQQAMNQKLAETENLKHHLRISSGETKYATNRAQRLYDRTEYAWWHTRGPEASRDLTTRERLDRPSMKVIQRHPGTNMPEAQEIVRSGGELLDSLRTTGRNIALLRIANEQLEDDITDKIGGYNIDNHVVKMRGSKSAHRWVLRAMPDVRKSA